MYTDNKLKYRFRLNSSDKIKVKNIKMIWWISFEVFSLICLKYLVSCIIEWKSKVAYSILMAESCVFDINYILNKYWFITQSQINSLSFENINLRLYYILSKSCVDLLIESNSSYFILSFIIVSY